MRAHIGILFLSTLFLSNTNIAEKYKENLVEEFSGRISRINVEARLVRVKSEFANIKYLNKKDIVQMAMKQQSNFRCESYVVGKSSDYLLLKVPDLDFCMKNISFAPGTYMNFFSKNLGQNMVIGKELVDILLKKRQALKGKLVTYKSELDSHIEKVDTVNKRYQLLREKLEAEWGKELLALEEDKTQSMRNYKGIELRLNEVEYKLEKYRVDDKNLKADRWSLDPQQYILK